MSKKKILITWPLPEAVMARARATYDVIAHGDDPKITIDELLETAKSVDAMRITLNKKGRKASARRKCVRGRPRGTRAGPADRVMFRGRDGR